MAKAKIISNGKLDKVGLKKIGKSFLLTVGAAIIGWIANSVGIVDSGFRDTIKVRFRYIMQPDDLILKDGKIQGMKINIKKIYQHPVCLKPESLLHVYKRHINFQDD